jgi:hypothetical protein
MFFFFVNDEERQLIVLYLDTPKPTSPTTPRLPFPILFFHSMQIKRKRNPLQRHGRRAEILYVSSPTSTPSHAAAAIRRTSSSRIYWRKESSKGPSNGVQNRHYPTLTAGEN